VSAERGNSDRSALTYSQPAAAAVPTRLVRQTRPSPSGQAGMAFHLHCPRCSSGVVARLAALVAVAPQYPSARFSARTGFDDPTSPPDAPPRESIEVRTLVFFPPEV
jgi:hypothetical protein